ncbi:MAG: hypothetical protein ABF289_15685 [Clostridiales bacterium]
MENRILDNEILNMAYKMDKNLYLVNEYNKILNNDDNKKYNLYNKIGLLNGYIGIGELENAEFGFEELYNKLKDDNNLNVLNRVAIGYGIVLAYRGKLSIAFLFFEEGLIISKEIGDNWMLYYGRIWRAMALAHFGEPSSIEKLYEVMEKCGENNFGYLYELASCFILVSTVILGKKIKEEEAKILIESINEKEAPGLKAQALACYIKLFGVSVEISDIVHKLVGLLLNCEGIKGYIFIINEVLDKYLLLVDKYLNNKIVTWRKKYIKPVIDDFIKVEKFYFDELDDRPRLKGCNLDNCDGICCYEGVYMNNEDEEEFIKKVVDDNKDYFSFLPEVFIKDNNWNDKILGRKVVTRPYKTKMKDYPKHFGKTMCSFSSGNGICSLQKLATDSDMHPWKYKPKTCWMFPVMGFYFGIPMSPPKKEDKDPSYIDDSYPGYVKYLPCGKESDKGEPWYRVYKQGIIYGKYLEME